MRARNGGEAAVAGFSINDKQSSCGTRSSPSPQSKITCSTID
jgi:hypothetical protein